MNGWSLYKESYDDGVAVVDAATGSGTAKVEAEGDANESANRGDVATVEPGGSGSLGC